MELTQRHVDALAAAEERLFHCDFCAYLDLKELLRDDSAAARERFRDRFTRFYGLNVGGLTVEFKERFFEILFDRDRVVVDGRPDFDGILQVLSTIERSSGSTALHFSFVSKLVAMHDEGSPIYDRHVLAFFREKAPSVAKGRQERIKGFRKFLDGAAADYRAWAAGERVVPILKRFRARDARLKRCDDVRLMDFLVWKVGNQKLL